MAESNLEARIRVLEDIEAIKKLHVKYWRSILKGLPDDLAECFTEDGVSHFSATQKVEGRKAIATYYREDFFINYSMRAPQGHNPDIEIIDDKTAKGTWFTDVTMVETSTKKAARLGVTYDDVYAKENGQWYIKSKRPTYIYNQAVEIVDMPVIQ